MTVPREVLGLDPGLGPWCIIHAWRGSVAHGMWEPNTDPLSIDDKDTMAICVPPDDYYYGLLEYGSRGTVEIVQDPWDIVVYDARKAIGLLAKGNPNVLSLLWLPETLYIRREAAGRLLLKNRDAFVGRHVYASFVGYANAQLRKMEHGVHRGYMGQKRQALVERFGFDTKNASHLIRLLRMGIEFLRDGELRVDRGGLDANELLAIKHGEWSLGRVKEEAERLFRRAEDAYDRSTLPPRPDEARIQKLCVDVIRMAHRDLRPDPYDD